MGIVDTIKGLMPVSRRTVAAAQRENYLLRERLKASGISSGVEMSWGAFDYEHSPDLKGSKRWAALDQMESDPHVKGALRSNVLPLIRATWEYKPASDDERDVEIAEFCSANLLRKDTERFGRDYWCETSWNAQRLPEILTMLRDGFSVFHHTTRVVGTKRVFDRIQWIEPHTIDADRPWEIDQFDNILAVRRRYEKPDHQFEFDDPIDAENLALYVWDLKGARYEGRSLIRSMWGAFARKRHIQKVAAIWAQKSGAPVPVGHYPQGWPQPHIDRFEEFLKAMRGTSPAEAFGMFEKGPAGAEADVKYVGADLDVERGMRGLVEMENQEISHAAGTKSDMLGETQSGSRALGDTQQSRELQQIEAVAQIVAEWEMHGVANIHGLADRLVFENYGPRAKVPELVFSGIRPDEGFENFDEIVKAWDSRLIPHHPDARRQLVERFGLELPDEAYEVEEPLPLPAVPPAPGAGAQEPEADETERLAAADRTAEFRSRIERLLAPSQEGAPPSGGRFPDGTGAGLCGAGRGAGSVPGRGA